MADRYRRSNKDRRALNTKIDSDSYLYLNEIAGEMSLGWAIEQLVKHHKESRQSTTKALPPVASSSSVH